MVLGSSYLEALSRLAISFFIVFTQYSPDKYPTLGVRRDSECTCLCPCLGLATCIHWDGTRVLTLKAARLQIQTWLEVDAHPETFNRTP